MLLILLWPSETAGPEHDHGPEWLPPEQELKAKLRELSIAAEQVRSEIAAQASPSPEIAPLAQPNALPREAREKIPEWKRRCLDLYVRCRDEWGWTGNCHDCFRYCEGQHQWPEDKCYPPG